MNVNVLCTVGMMEVVLFTKFSAAIWRTNWTCVQCKQGTVPVAGVNCCSVNGITITADITVGGSGRHAIS